VDARSYHSAFSEGNLLDVLKTPALQSENPSVIGRDMAAGAEPVAAARVTPRRASKRVADVRESLRLRHRVEYAVVRALAWVLTALPLALALRLGACVGTLLYLVSWPHRRIGMRNLAIALPERSRAEHRRILRHSLQNLGRTAVEIVRLPTFTDAQLLDMVRFEDEAWWREAIGRERDTGGLILSGHFGNWELLVYAHGRRGYPVSMVHRTIANPLIDRWLNDIRARAGTKLVRKARAATGVLRTMRDRGLLVLPFDQNSTRGLGVFVPFFGLPASTNSGIARIALRSGAPIVPVFIVRQGTSARHRVYVLPFVEAEHTGDFEADVVRTTERCSLVFEDMVRQHPEQWLWIHRRWKTRPAGEERFY
jgi:KDO2-lipid IV(A) lauroyltransferase